MYGLENISSIMRIISADVPDQLMIKVLPSVARDLGLKEGQIIQGTISEKGNSIKFSNNTSEISYAFNLTNFKGQKFNFNVNNNNNEFILKSSIKNHVSGISEGISDETKLVSDYSRWARLFQQSPILQQVALLASGGKLINAMYKNGYKPGSGIEDFFEEKSGSTTIDKVKKSIDMSGLIGTLLSKENLGLSNKQPIIRSIREFKSFILNSGENSSELINEIDIAIDYLDSNKLKRYISKKNGFNYYKFFIPIDKVSSAQIIFSEIESTLLENENFSRNSQNSLSDTLTYSNSKSPETDLNHKRPELNTFSEKDGSNGNSDERDMEGKNSDRNAGDNQGSNVRKRDWAVELDWSFSLGDKISMRAEIREKVGMSLTFWINNTNTYSFAKAHKNELVKKIEGLDLPLVSCNILPTLRPVDIEQSPAAKSNFMVDV
tara:strand:+ start:336 stop:1640 length:1305 start_codon:yes stop_codon:yes gene_type:complete